MKYHSNSNADPKTKMLINAICNNNITIVNKLIQDRVDINKHQEDYQPVITFDNSNNSDIMNYSIRIEKYNRFPLIQAMECGNYEIAKILLNNGADPNVKNKNDTALYKYLRLSFYQENIDLEIFTLLLAKGAVIGDADILYLKRIFAKKLFTVKELVILMKQAGLFYTDKAFKTSIAELTYNGLKFLHKDYLSFDSFSRADKFPSLLSLTAKAAAPIIYEYLKVKNKSKQEVQANDIKNDAASEIETDPLVQLINEMMHEGSNDKEYQLTSIMQIQEIINNIEIELLGGEND